jgi:glycosyltransferase involved in cell wall biosynthesis
VEGIHCSYLLSDERFKQRRIFLRLHNVEYIYYRQLLNATSSMFKKLYYAWESKLLFRYEQTIACKVPIIAVSEDDCLVYRKLLQADRVYFVPVFVPYVQVTIPDNTGSYCLYHGNLSVPENEKAVMWLLEHVFQDLETSFVIAGRNPSSRLKKTVAKKGNTCIAENPSEKDLLDLITKAQIHILPSFNTTGVKLKLLNALFNGRHCVVNEAAISGTKLSKVCHIGRTASELKTIITQLYHQPVSDEDLQLRKSILESMYDNRQNAERLIQLIW